MNCFSVLRGAVAALTFPTLALAQAPAGPILPGPLYAAGPSAAIVASGDMNNDGRPDVVASGGSELDVLRADGAGGFSPPMRTILPVATYCHALADLNRDGRLDVVVAGTDDRVYVLLGNGDGTLGVPSSYATAPSPWSLATGDFNGDGNPDVVTVVHAVGPQAAVAVLLGDGAGGLGPVATHACADSPYHLAVGDVDADGAVDVAVACNTSPVGVVSLLRGDGQGGFSAPQSFSVGSSAHCVRIADIDGDGRLDLVSTSVLAHEAAVLLNTGNATFAAPIASPAGGYPAFFAVVDADGDGRADLAVCDSFANTASLLRGNGNGTFRAPVPYSVASGPTTILAADVDGDGRADLITGHANGDDKLTLLLGKAGGSFGGANQHATSLAYPFGVAIGDLDEDGRPDLVAVDYCGIACGDVSVFLADAVGGFAPAVPVAIGASGPVGVVVADVDNDHHLDVLTANRNPSSGSSSVSVLLGDGHGAFPRASALPTGPMPSHLATADLDGDGNLDLVVCGYGSNAVEVHAGGGNGSFVLRQSIATGLRSGPIQTVLGDFDGDGRLDLAVALVGLPDALFARGSPGGTFAAPIAIAVGATQSGIAAADLDHDGRLDLALSTSAGIRVLRGDGAGGFTLTGTFTAGLGMLATAAADVDGDGNVDLLGAGVNLTLSLGDGRGGFAAPLWFADSVTQYTAPHGLAVGDLDADGRLDVVTANYYARAVQVMRGQRALPAGIVAYGAGTPGCGGRLGMAATRVPQAGQTAFSVTATNAPRAAAGFFLLGTGALVPGVDLFRLGILIEVDPLAGPFFVLPMSSDVVGTAAFALPIPGNVQVGLRLTAQTVWLQPAGSACGAGALGLVSSRGVEVTIQ